MLHLKRWYIKLGYRRCSIRLAVPFFLIILMIFCVWQNQSALSIKFERECYLYKKHGFGNHFLTDILLGEPKPHSQGKNIFFHVTDCSTDNVIHLDARQACSIESAARAHPDWNVFVLFTARVGFNNASALPIIDHLLSASSNIYLRHLNIRTYTKDSPIYEWLASGEFYTKSNLPNMHLSDILRLLSLWKYGGIYLDSDVVVQKSFVPLGSNYVAAESEAYVCNAVLNFNLDSSFILDKCFNEMMYNFDGKWTLSNGQSVITNVLRKICNVSDMHPVNCNGVKVLASSYFSPISFTRTHHFFSEAYAGVGLEQIKDSYAVHLWNEITKYSEVQVGSYEVYRVLAGAFCPKIYGNCGSVF